MITTQRLPSSLTPLDTALAMLLDGLAPVAPSVDPMVRKQALAIASSLLDEIELRVIRERLRKQRSRLRSTLESYLRGKETAKYLQDQVVSERNGRYVLLVKAEHRSGIPGIVHGTSTSGASTRRSSTTRKFGLSERLGASRYASLILRACACRIFGSLAYGVSCRARASALRR